MAPLTRSKAQSITPPSNHPHTTPERRSNKRLKKRMEHDIPVDNTEKFPVRTACGICKATKHADSFHAECMHHFCLPCIKEVVVKVIRDQVETASATYSNLTTHIMCPYPRCTSELSRTELIRLLGWKVVRYYENWLTNAFDTVYRPYFHKDSRLTCVSCKSDKPMVVSAAKISELSYIEANDALKVRGFEKNLSKRNCKKVLRSMIGVDAKRNTMACWICITCDAAWCVACGARIPIIMEKNNQKMTHGFCKERELYEIHENILCIEHAWKNYRVKSAPDEFQHSSGLENKEEALVWAKGTGFGGDIFSEVSLFEAESIQLEVDLHVGKALKRLTKLLNRGIAEGQDETLPEPSMAVFAVLKSGNILYHLLKQLFVNDSMLDISSRRRLYLKAVSFLKSLKPQVKLLQLVTGCEGNHDETSKEEDWINQLGMEKGKGKEDVQENEPVVKFMENVYIQAKILLQSLENEEGAKHRADINLAKELCECYELLSENLPPDQSLKIDFQISSSIDVTMDLDQQLKNANLMYKQKMKPLQFILVSMIGEDGNYRHHYRNEIKPESASCIDSQGVQNQKRMRRILQEITSLSTSLPLEWESSIYLRADEVRMDVLRALIIGPCGTPYQNGVFCFDIFLPFDYPEQPPRVQFLTTGGGSVSFNPNLYDDGTVCLSLLGTWEGPRWLPGRSTLLQVLVSIQSLIFVKDPFYNEPSYEYQVNPKAEQENERENERYRKHTLSVAILGALRRPDPYFQDVIQLHFNLKSAELERQFEEWVAAASDSNKKDMLKITKKIKKILGL